MADDGYDDDLDDLDDLWSSFAEQWEKTFKKMSEAEDERLRLLSKQGEQLVADLAVADAKAAELKQLGADAKAKHASQVTGAVLDLQHQHAAKELRYGAEAGRASTANSAMRESDDMLRDVEQRMAQRRVEAEAKRKEAKLKREAEAEARMRAREKAREQAAGSNPSAGSASAGPAGAAGGPGGASQRTHSDSKGAGTGPKPPASRPGGAARSMASFAEYDAAWGAFEQQLRRGTEAGKAPWVGVADIPWPTGLRMVSGITPEDTPRECKKKLRAAVLRWHPDKWAPVLELVVEQSRAEVLAKVQEVTRRILDERKLRS